MIEAIDFNATTKFVSNYEGSIPLVRTGTVKTSSLKSFCNALLLSCSKKFILENDEEKIRSIDKLETDFQINHRENEIFSDFYKELVDKMHTLLGDFYNFIGDKTYKIEQNSLVMNLILSIFSNNRGEEEDDDDDDAKTKVDFYIIIKTLFTVNDLKKITKLRHKTIDSLSNLKSLLLKDVKHFMKFQDIGGGDENDKARFIKLNTLLLVDKMFDVVVESMEVPNFNSNQADEIFIKLATAHFQTNIFIIDSKTEQIQFYTDYNSKLKTIILLSFDSNNHFEIIGKLRQGNIINRQFFPYEDVVQSILFHSQSGHE
jgi:hypothetical protein